MGNRVNALCLWFSLYSWRSLDTVGKEACKDRSHLGKTFLKENNHIALDIEDKVRAAHGLDFEMPEVEKTAAVKDDAKDDMDGLIEG